MSAGRQSIGISFVPTVNRRVDGEERIQLGRVQHLRIKPSEIRLNSQCFDFDIAEVDLDPVLALLLAPL